MIVAIYGDGYKPTLLPKFTSNIYAQFQSDPIWGEAKLVARVDADWRSRIRYISGATALAIPEYAPLRYGPQRWLLNTRIGFENVGPLHMNISFWTRNLTNNKDPLFPLQFAAYEVATNFQQARTFGVDTSFRF